MYKHYAQFLVSRYSFENAWASDINFWSTNPFTSLYFQSQYSHFPPKNISFQKSPLFHSLYLGHFFTVFYSIVAYRISCITFYHLSILSFFFFLVKWLNNFLHHCCNAFFPCPGPPNRKLLQKISSQVLCFSCLLAFLIPYYISLYIAMKSHLNERLNESHYLVSVFALSCFNQIGTFYLYTCSSKSHHFFPCGKVIFHWIYTS